MLNTDNCLSRNDIQPGKKYQIMYKDSYSNRKAIARGVDSNGDVTLEFKNGSQVVYHTSWLKDI